MEFLGEMPPFIVRGVLFSSVKKFHIYSKLFFEINKDEWSDALKNWKGQENWLRLPFRLAACILPGIIGGLSDHMPGDYYQQVVNSDKDAWQPLKRTEGAEGVPMNGAAGAKANRKYEHLRYCRTFHSFSLQVVWGTVTVVCPCNRTAPQKC